MDLQEPLSALYSFQLWQIVSVIWQYTPALTSGAIDDDKSRDDENGKVISIEGRNGSAHAHAFAHCSCHPHAQAMEQMSRMTPQQMADMQRQMASLPPGFVQQQMAAMNSMDPAQLQRSMRDANNNVSPGQSQGPLSPSPHSMQEVWPTWDSRAGPYERVQKTLLQS